MPEIIADNISIVETNELERFSRIDAEYYHPKYLVLQKLYKKGNWSPIGCHLRTCEYGLSIAMNTEGKGYGILRMDNLQGGFAFDDDLKYAPINEEVFDKYKLQKNDVLFNRVNSEEFVGRTGIYKLSGNHVFASYLVRCQTKENELLPDYLNIFLNTKYGILSIRRMSRRAVNQANVNAQELKAIKIPLPPLRFQEEIRNLLEKSHELFEKSKILYSQAEVLLLEELGLRDIDLSHEFCYVVNSADTISASRIDAEYYQPKYERIIEAIKKHDHKEFWEIAFVDKTANPPYSKQKEIPIITQKHLGYYQIDEKFLVDPETEYTTAQFTKQYSKYVLQKEDILLYSVGAYIGKANIFNLDVKAVSGSFLTIIRADKTIVDPYYLLGVLNSLVGATQSKRHSKATAQQYLYPADIRKFIIPILNKTIQEKIGQFIIDANSARRQAKKLLEEAKKKVEEMIENGQED